MADTVSVSTVSSATRLGTSGFIVPNRWQGESDCLVGPFSSHTVATYFANNVVDFGQFETISRRVFVKGDAYYVEVTKCDAAPTFPQPSKA